MEHGQVGRALAYLDRDPLLHMGMIEALRRDQAELLYAREDGVLFLEKKSGAYMLSASSENAGNRLIDTLDNAGLFLAHQEYCVSALVKKFAFRNRYDCVQAVYGRKTYLPLSERFQIAVLSGAHVETVLECYHTMEDPDYIRGRIQSGDMYGAFLNGDLLGFIGVHEEGSIGLLEVLPDCRRLGVGSFLESYMINEHLRKGWTPFCQVFEDNQASLSLQKRLGLELSNRRLFWLF